MHKLVTIQDNTIQAMAKDARFAGTFDFLAAVNNINKSGGCSKCGRKSANGAVFMDIKKAIAALPLERKLELKRLLNAEQCEVFVNDGGVPKRVAF